MGMEMEGSGNTGSGSSLPPGIAAMIAKTKLRSIQKKSPCSGPSGMNATCNPNAPKKPAAISSFSSTDVSNLTIA
jgi:hypothetical protein